MGLERWISFVNRAFMVLLVLTIAYMALSLLVALFFQVVISEWPFIVLIPATLAVTGVYTALVMELRRRKRRLVTGLSAEAEAWPESPAARAAALTGTRLTRIDGLRAHARTPHVVELSWNPPLDSVDEVVVYRSTTGFAASPEPGGDQVNLCRAVEVTFVDTGLEDERVYFYTALGYGRDGSWSSPSWAWAVTPRVPLHSTILGSMRTLREGNFDA